MVRLARHWTGSGVRAAALVRRADLVVEGAGGRFAGKELRDVQRIVTLPRDMLLVLRERDVLLLVASKGWLLAPPATRLSRWPMGGVEVVIGPGCGPFRPLRITDRHSTLTVAAPWIWGVQREALEVIERVAGQDARNRS